MTRGQSTLASCERDILLGSHLLTFSFAPPNQPKLTGINNSHFIKLMNFVGQEFRQRIASVCATVSRISAGKTHTAGGNSNGWRLGSLKTSSPPCLTPGLDGSKSRLLWSCWPELPHLASSCGLGCSQHGCWIPRGSVLRGSLWRVNILTESSLPSLVYSFPVAATTNYHKLSAFKQCTFWRSAVQTLGENLFPCLF